MGGTGEPDPGTLPVYMAHMEQYYLVPFGPCPSAGSCDYESLDTPEQFWPIPGWGGPTAITFNQSAHDGAADLESVPLTPLTPAESPSYAPTATRPASLPTPGPKLSVLRTCNGSTAKVGPDLVKLAKTVDSAAKPTQHQH